MVLNNVSASENAVMHLFFFQFWKELRDVDS